MIKGRMRRSHIYFTNFFAVIIYLSPWMECYINQQLIKSISKAMQRIFCVLSGVWQQHTEGFGNFLV